MCRRHLIFFGAWFALAFNLDAQGDDFPGAQLFSTLTTWPDELRTTVLAEVHSLDDASLVELDLVKFLQVRQENRDGFELTLPCPTGYADRDDEALTFWLERFHVHPPALKVGITSDRGFEEFDYEPQLQSFKLHLNGSVVGTIVLMTDHILGSFHCEGQQYDLTHLEGNVYAVLDFNKRRNLPPFACAVEDAPFKEAIENVEKRAGRSNNGGCVEVAIDGVGRGVFWRVQTAHDSVLSRRYDGRRWQGRGGRRRR